MKYPKWDDLSNQEQLYYKNLVAEMFPNDSVKELEKKQKNIIKSIKTLRECYI